MLSYENQLYCANCGESVAITEVTNTIGKVWRQRRTIIPVVNPKRYYHKLCGKQIRLRARSSHEYSGGLKTTVDREWVKRIE